jgi:diacylglycerol kinase (ATP)
LRRATLAIGSAAKILRDSKNEKAGFFNNDMKIRTDMKDSKQPMSEFKSKSGAKRIFGAFFYSMAGFRAAWKNEHAFRQELVLVIIAAVVALSLSVPTFEKLILIGVFVLVLIVELLNSAIEAAVDRVSLERNPLSKDAKDLGSAAVFLTLSLAAATWVVILLPLCAR